MTEFTVHIKYDDPWWIAWVDEIPGANCQEKTFEDVIDSIKMMVEESGELP